jgi:[1-hydroxy-2-(trimethylamino)ethyl]phosphonate dioxygenase
VNTDVVDLIFAAFQSGGAAAYLGEPVTLREHMLQTARAAELDGAPDYLIAAALLHDYGHLIHGGPENAAEHGVDTEHEEVGYRFLAEHFPPRVIDPVRMHVAAKRYLCAVEPGYHDVLSPASQLSLELQGGPMSADEVAAFEAEPYYREACSLRRYDDVAKDPWTSAPPLEHYRDVLEASLSDGGAV